MTSSVHQEAIDYFEDRAANAGMPREKLVELATKFSKIFSDRRAKASPQQVCSHVEIKQLA